MDKMVMKNIVTLWAEVKSECTAERLRVHGLIFEAIEIIASECGQRVESEIVAERLMPGFPILSTYTEQSHGRYSFVAYPCVDNSGHWPIKISTAKSYVERSRKISAGIVRQTAELILVENS